jgi:hypothetical protein
VPLAFLEFKLFHFSQQNMLHSVPNYNIEITPHKHTIPMVTKSSKTNNIGKVVSSFNSSLKSQWVKIMASFARYGF